MSSGTALRSPTKDETGLGLGYESAAAAVCRSEVDWCIKPGIEFGRGSCAFHEVPLAPSGATRAVLRFPLIEGPPPPSARKETTVELKYERCAGLDVHKETVVACVRVATGGGKANHEVRSFATTTRALLELSAWLGSCQVKAVAMEATGVYWRPVWHVLEDEFELTLANARAVKGLPGRKTDVNDATWLSDLLAHGLIRGNFVPERPMADLRDLLRTRKQFTREKVRHTQRIQKVLEDANIKLDSVISNVVGVSGRRILRAIIEGQSSEAFLASLGSDRLKATKKDLEDACRGFLRDHHRLLLRVELDEVEHIEGVITQLEGEVAKLLEPFRGAV